MRRVLLAAAVLFLSAASASEPGQPLNGDIRRPDPSSFLEDCANDVAAQTLISAYGKPLWNGTQYALVWIGSSGINFARFDAYGVQIGNDTLVTPTSPNVTTPALAWNGTEYGLVWQVNLSADDHDLYFMRIDASGAAISPPLLTLDGGYFSGWSTPAMVWNGSRYGLAMGVDSSYVHLYTFDASGVRLTSTSVGSGWDPTLVWTGTEFAIAYHYHLPSDVFLARFTSDGTRVAPDAAITHRTTICPLRDFDLRYGLAWTGSHYGLVWLMECTSPLRREVRLSRLDSLGAEVTPPILVTPPNVQAESPMISWSGNEFALAWVDARTGTSVPYFTRFSPEGNRLNADLPFATGAPTLRGLAAGPNHFAAITGTAPATLTVFRCDCSDLDGDSYSSCRDCDDSRPDVYPGHLEECDGIDNDCDGTADAFVTTCGQGACSRSGICSGGVDSCVPGFPAPELCNGIDDDCNGALDELDQDGDTSGACWGDCNDTDASVYPGAPEVCNGIDDNCNSQFDEDTQGLDSDGDSIRNACDNCRSTYNPSQLDTDADAVGNSCDNCTFVNNPAQADLDSDARGDLCDNCPSESNPLQDDFDADSAGDACDNCVLAFNPDQRDFDSDLEGDRCDLDDGLLLLFFNEPDYVEWQEEAGYSGWNVYTGDLAVLRATGVYTQVPGSNALTWRECGLAVPYAEDSTAPDAGQAAFFLVTGVSGGVEGSLGNNSAGTDRPNANPCPESHAAIRLTEPTGWRLGGFTNF